MTKFIATFLAALLLFTPAAHAGRFSCTEGFTLEKTGRNSWRLSGTLEVPTPGYTYDIGEPTGIAAETVRLPLRLTAPAGMTAAVTSSLAITHDIEAGDDLVRVTVSILKDFNWGPDIVDCALQRSVE